MGYGILHAIQIVIKKMSFKESTSSADTSKGPRYADKIFSANKFVGNFKIPSIICKLNKNILYQN